MIYSDIIIKIFFWTGNKQSNELTIFDLKESQFFFFNI